MLGGAGLTVNANGASCSPFTRSGQVQSNNPPRFGQPGSVIWLQQAMEPRRWPIQPTLGEESSAIEKHTAGAVPHSKSRHLLLGMRRSSGGFSFTSRKRISSMRLLLPLTSLFALPLMVASLSVVERAQAQTPYELVSQLDLECRRAAGPPPNAAAELGKR